MRSFCVALLAAPCFFLPGCRDEGAGESGSAPPSGASVNPPPASPGDSDPRLEEALVKIAADALDEARAIIAVVLADHPGSYRCRFLKAYTWHRQKRYEKARKGFEEVLRSGAVFAGSDSILHFHGWALYHLGRLREAEAAFKKHATLVQQTAGTWFALGLIALEGNRLGEAESFLARARELQARDPRKKKELAKTLARLGEVHTLQGRLEPARKDLEEAVRTWPDHYNAHYRLYRVLLHLGDKEAAESALKRHQGIAAEAPAGRAGS